MTAETATQTSETECPACHWINGHWAFCKASTASDWERLGEPMASEVARDRTAR